MMKLQSSEKEILVSDCPFKIFNRNLSNLLIEISIRILINKIKIFVLQQVGLSAGVSAGPAMECLCRRHPAGFPLSFREEKKAWQRKFLFWSVGQDTVTSRNVCWSVAVNMLERA